MLFRSKHVRERIERFVESNNFEPVLFESDNVTFEHNKPLDVSCYNEVKLCHIMILIIGGRYGSIISGENIPEKKEKYNKEYVSITRKEYETALKMNIPVFIFIEKNVYSDYQTFRKNKVFFDNVSDIKPKNNFTFAHVDDINVFNFISVLQEKPVKTFERVEEIENYLGHQIAGMLYLYLQKLQEDKKEDKVLDSVAELQNIVERMSTMIQAVGENVIKDNSLEEVIFNQNKILIDYFVGQLTDNIKFKEGYYDVSKETVLKAYFVFKETILNFDLISEAKSEKDWKKESEKFCSLELRLKEELDNLDDKIKIENFDYYKIANSFIKNIYPIISNNEKLSNYFDKKMVSELETEISGLPF